MRSITVRNVEIFTVALDLVERLRTSFGEEPFKSAVLVAVHTDDGIIGWGECSAEILPGYSYETIGTNQHVLKEFLIPAILGKTISSPTEVPALISATRGHPLAKFGLEAAVWDAFAKANDLLLADLFASYLPPEHKPRGYANVGVSIGIKPTIDETLQVIALRLKQGYGRIKLKIQPGWDVELAREVRKVFPDILLMLDANSAYTLADAEYLKQLDEFNLLMIEQPLGYADIYEHSRLKPQIKTPLCLDECILSANDLRLALALDAISILNLKPARVGGYTESLECYRVCVENKVPLWIGGQLEAGIGRAANVAFASLPGVNLPCDISATDRYYDPDLTESPFRLGPNSTIAAPTAPGIGVTVEMDRIRAAAASWEARYPYQYRIMV